MKIKKNEKKAMKVANKEPQIELGMVFAKPDKPEKLYFVCDVRPRCRLTGTGAHGEPEYTPTGTTEGRLATDGLGTGFIVQGSTWFSLAEQHSWGYEVVNKISPEAIKDQLSRADANTVKEKKVIKAPPVRKRPEGPTIAETIMAALKEGKNGQDVLDVVCAVHKDCCTTMACVSFYKSKLKKAGLLPVAAEKPMPKAAKKFVVKGKTKKGKK